MSLGYEIPHNTEQCVYTFLIMIITVNYCIMYNVKMNNYLNMNSAVGAKQLNNPSVNEKLSVIVSTPQGPYHKLFR